jgi:hypothetical protein
MERVVVRASLVLLLAAGCFNDPGPPILPRLVCPTQGVILCDGFETGNAEKWNAQPYTAGGGTGTIDETRPHTGKWALDTMAGGGGVAVVQKNIEPAQTTGMLAVRAWVNIAAAAASPGPFIGLYNRQSTQDVYVTIDNGKWTYEGDGETTTPSDVPATLNVWTCVELDYTLQPPSFDLYIDGAHPLGPSASNLQAPAFDLVSVGVENPSSPVHTFTDDVVIATGHIGCD